MIEYAVGMVNGIILAGLFTTAVIYKQGRHRPEPPQPVCGCGHHWSFHNDSGGCHHLRSYDHQCGCVKYYGPEPVPTDLIP